MTGAGCERVTTRQRPASACQPEVRERIGEWLARGYGSEFLAEMDSHFAHLGPSANHAPVAEHLRREFVAEIERARQENDELLRL